HRRRHQLSQKFEASSQSPLKVASRPAHALRRCFTPMPIVTTIPRGGRRLAHLRRRGSERSRKDTQMATCGSMTRRVPMRRLMTACAVALLMVATACGRVGHHGGTTSGDMDKRRAYAQCMRDNGVSNFPDPDPNGRFGAGHDAIDRDDPTFKAA